MASLSEPRNIDGWHINRTANRGPKIYAVNDWLTFTDLDQEADAIGYWEIVALVMMRQCDCAKDENCELKSKQTGLSKWSSMFSFSEIAWKVYCNLCESWIVWQLAIWIDNAMANGGYLIHFESVESMQTKAWEM